MLSPFSARLTLEGSLGTAAAWSVSTLCSGRLQGPGPAHHWLALEAGTLAVSLDYVGFHGAWQRVWLVDQWLAGGVNAYSRLGRY